MCSNSIKNIYLILLFVALSSCSLNYPSTRSGPESQTSTKNTQVPVGTGSEIPANVDPKNIENFYVINGRRYAVLKSSAGFTESGIASWYGDPFHGRETSNGETYDMHLMTAAHKHLPLPSYVEVTNAQNGKKVVLRVNDRGPFVGDRVIDLSFAAAQALDVVQSGTASVHIRGLDDLNRAEDAKRLASPERPAFIQIASFAEKNNAHAYHQSLIRQGINESLIHQTRTDNGQNVFRIQIGPIESGDEYDKSILALNKIGITKTILIRE